MKIEEIFPLHGIFMEKILVSIVSLPRSKPSIQSPNKEIIRGANTQAADWVESGFQTFLNT